jgi:endonuclease/exonuclease/phosphatase family metal-dependent hydrolase
MGEITFANVHLSHGQLLNRRQLARIAAALQGKPSAIIGDYNAVGPIFLPGFADVGPREPTHLSGNVMPVRLDRCLAHRLVCSMADALDFGPSDHRPIRLELRLAESTEIAEPFAISKPRPRGFYR